MTVAIRSRLPALAERLRREEVAFRAMEVRPGSGSGFLLFREGRMQLVPGSCVW